jgi:hypothetical protein
MGTGKLSRGWVTIGMLQNKVGWLEMQLLWSSHAEATTQVPSVCLNHQFYFSLNVNSSTLSLNPVVHFSNLMQLGHVKIHSWRKIAFNFAFLICLFGFRRQGDWAHLVDHCHSWCFECTVLYSKWFLVRAVRRWSALHVGIHWRQH